MNPLAYIAIVLAFPVGFYLGLAALAFAALIGLAGWTVGLILLGGLATIMLVDSGLDCLGSAVMKSVAKPDPETEERIRTTDSAIRRHSVLAGALGVAVAMIASLIWPVSDILDATSGLLPF